jgi:hypothetical protein
LKQYWQEQEQYELLVLHEAGPRESASTHTSLQSTLRQSLDVSQGVVDWLL